MSFFPKSPPACILAIAMVLFAAVTGLAQDRRAAVPQADVIAAMLLNFPAYVRQGLDDQSSTYRIGVAGDSAVEDSLWRLSRNRTIQGRPVEVVRLLRSQQIATCLMVYVGDRPSLQDFGGLALGAMHTILVIGPEATGEGEFRGHIWLYVEEGRMRFGLDPELAVQSRLRFDARLLQLAGMVKEGTE